MNRIDHTKCNHEATPKARKACRKAHAARAERVEREGRFDADMARLDAAKLAERVGQAETAANFPWTQPSQAPTGPQADTERFTKRGIVINFRLAGGQRCSVAFDRFGMNSELFRMADQNRWGAKRVVSQACSNAIHGVMQSYPGVKIEDYTVVEVS
jgi:hypothetical protein